MKTRQTKRKVYRSMLEIAKDFFPALYNKAMEERASDDPWDVGARIAKESLDEARRHIQKVVVGKNWKEEGK